MVTAISKDGIKRRLIYHQHLLLVSDDDKITFDLNQPNNEFKIPIKLTFVFADEGGKELTQKGRVIEGENGADKEIEITLIKWNSPTGVENKKPVVLNSKSGDKIWVKYQTSKPNSGDFRKFTLTAWREDNGK